MSDGVRPLEDRNSARVFDEHRDLLISVAYRVLGRVTDAEDTVQDVGQGLLSSRQPRSAHAS